MPLHLKLGNISVLITFYWVQEFKVLQIAQLLANTLFNMFCVSFSHEMNFEWLSNDNENNKIGLGRTQKVHLLAILLFLKSLSWAELRS